MWFQVHYPPLVGVLPTFRSRYWCAIGRQRVLSLARWTSLLQTRFHVSSPTQGTGSKAFLAAYGTITRSGQAFQTCSAKNRFLNAGPTPPERQALLVWAFPRSLAATRSEEHTSELQSR